MSGCRVARTPRRASSSPIGHTTFLVQRCGGNVEAAEEIIAGWHQAVAALGWGDLVAAIDPQGVDMSADLIEFTGRRWLADTRTAESR